MGILEKIEQNINNVSVKDFETLLDNYGFLKKRQKGSHAHYYNKTKHIFFAFPHKKPIKICYVKTLLQLIKENYEK
ncbi:MAG: type II toxin-antitoxin system HicA family toxin [Candidatus Gracilibacteria bacterium]|nr:type II toxin-antitoxin system HicA family toxin [Candidatus Gracilibacteria bacterium]